MAGEQQDKAKLVQENMFGAPVEVRKPEKKKPQPQLTHEEHLKRQEDKGNGVSKLIVLPTTNNAK
ncbi:MAG: hypothetical protein WAV41_03210 [Microgenomates group bacterium]